VFLLRPDKELPRLRFTLLKRPHSRAKSRGVSINKVQMIKSEGVYVCWKQLPSF